MWFGKPTSAGTSNDSSPRTIMIRTPAKIAGFASGSVIRRKTVRSGAPLITADSSSEGSIERNDATISRNTSGARCSPSTSDIPYSEKMLKGWLPSSGSITFRLRIPICGLARKIQAIVCRIPGMISGTSEAAYINGLNGTSVRTTRCASPVRARARRRRASRRSRPRSTPGATPASPSPTTTL